MAENGTDDGRTFANLMEAREAVCREVSTFEGLIQALKGDLSALEALGLHVVEQHKSALGPTATGLYHCAERALEGVGALEAALDRLHEAAVVARANDPTRLSAEAARYQPGPHRETY